MITVSSADWISTFGHVVGLTMALSLLSTSLAACAGFPAGAWLAMHPFAFRHLVRRVLQTLTGLPPVIAGLVVFMILSRKGPLGSLNLLFTFPAMVMAQVILIFPIIASLTLTSVESRLEAVRETLGGAGCGPLTIIRMVLWECRHSLITALLTGFGRALSEVGAVMMVGGNIEGRTRVLTTAILLETNKGQFSQAIVLGAILLTLAFTVNAAVIKIQEVTRNV